MTANQLAELTDALERILAELAETNRRLSMIEAATDETAQHTAATANAIDALRIAQD